MQMVDNPTASPATQPSDVLEDFSSALNFVDQRLQYRDKARIDNALGNPEFQTARVTSKTVQV
jgi:hypothetical protein